MQLHFLINAEYLSYVPELRFYTAALIKSNTRTYFQYYLALVNKRHHQSLAKQARIVAILDKFDTLTSSISEGLPREIALRQQQYEYYRDQLLSFKEGGA
jgi:glutamate synthase domain-containing protein 3